MLLYLELLVVWFTYFQMHVSYILHLSMTLMMMGMPVVTTYGNK